jgi:hypothetical protein
VQRIVDDSQQQQQQHDASKFVEDKTGISIIAISISPSLSPFHGPPALFFLV